MFHNFETTAGFELSNKTNSLLIAAPVTKPLV